MGEFVILDETRLFLGNQEITEFVRTGHQKLKIEDGRVVFANTGRPWTPGRTGVRMRTDESGD